MIYYKVVSVDFYGFKGLTSACQNSFFFEEEFRVVYEKDKKSLPHLENSKLFVFSDLQSAITFARTLYRVEVWECEVENPVETQLLGEIDVIAKYWRSCQSGVFAKAAPPNTVMVDSVTLRNRVKDAL